MGCSMRLVDNDPQICVAEADTFQFQLQDRDPLDHHNWEISEKWLKDYEWGFRCRKRSYVTNGDHRLLVDDEVYAISNRWRVEQGKQILVRAKVQDGPSGAAVAPSMGLVAA